jgi:hypothetical protein
MNQEDISDDPKRQKRTVRTVAAFEMATPGTDDFAKIRAKGSLFVDKSSFIKIFMKDANEVNVILRPRRFGKSLNLSMLRYFFSNAILSDPFFQDLEIFKDKDFCTKHMNKYPVVYLCLKECQARTWASMKKRLASKLAITIGEYPSFVDSILGKHRCLDQPLKDRLGELPDEDLAEVLLLLMMKLYESFGKRVVLLIDEYDAPLNFPMATTEDEMQRNAFFSFFYSDTLKSNSALFKACLVGVVGSGSLSRVYSLGIAAFQDHIFDKCFGFTKDELQNVFNVQEAELNEIREWYNGYIFGSQRLINPWSFLKYVYNGRKVGSYWSQTSETTEALKNLISDNQREEIIEALEFLLTKIPRIDGTVIQHLVLVDRFDP